MEKPQNLLQANVSGMQFSTDSPQLLDNNDTASVTLDQRKKNAEKKRKYRQSKRQCETEEESLDHRQKEAAYKRKYREKKKQCETEQDVFENKKRKRDSNRRYREEKSEEELLHYRKRKMYAQKKNTHIFMARKSLDIFDESTVAYESIGRMTYTCQKCGVLMFKGEKIGGSL